MRALLVLLPLLLSAQPRDGDILERAACTLSDPAGARFTCERLTYSSGGLPVIAYYFAPAKPAVPRLPIVVFNRGGYVVKDQLPNLLPMFQRLAEAGFAIVAPMYRGSDGAPGHDELGGADLADLMNVVPLVGHLPSTDPGNLFLYGESRGGVMSLLALRDGFPARAAATLGAITDLAAYLQHDSRAARIVNTVWPDYDTRRGEIHSTRSALQWPEKLKKPLYLMHGGADRQVSPAQTLRLALLLEELGHTYGLTIFPGADHVLSKFQIDRDQQAIRWFRKHLRP